MDLTYIVLIAFSIYALFNGILQTIQDRELEKLKKEVEELKRRGKT